MLMISDLQETLDCDARTLRGIEAMLDRVRPGLVMLGGDNCNGKLLKRRDELKRYIDLISEPFERRGIPWAHVFGNHDHDIGVPAAEQQKIYEAKPYCVSKHTGAGVSGTSNYMLPVFGRGGELRFCIWALDSNNRWRGFCRDTGLPSDTPPRLTNSPEQCQRWDFIRFDQQLWYYKSSLALERSAGRRVGGMLVTHIAPHEFQAAKDNPAECRLCGAAEEKFSLGALNSGIFATLLERGDVKTIACGHTHENDFEAELFGIRLCLDACAGYSPYGIDGLRGGRVFELTERDDGAAMNTYMVRAGQ